ncbi:hypothetical protein D3C80_1702850 [compost metagenome]
MTVAGGLERRAVIQLADPVIGRGGGAEAGGAGVVEDAALVGQAHHLVMHHAAVDGPDAGEDAFVQRTGQRRQLAFELVQGRALGAAVGLQMPQRMPGHLVVQAIQ